MLINGPEIEIENEYETDMENLLISHDKEMMSSKYVPFYVLMSGPKKVNKTQTHCILPHL